MKVKFLTILAVTATCSVVQAEVMSQFKNEKEQLGYALGVNYGTMFLRQDVELDPDALLRGLKDVLSSNKTLLTEEQVRQTLNDAQSRIREKQQAKAKVLGAENKKKADDFLAANKDKAGVTATASGLQYKVLSTGNGPKPVASDSVTVHYKGTLLDGTEFDSSYKRGQPATFGVTGVIKGWTEALQLMNAGSKWELYIPPDLAYGEQGRPNIPPNSLLVFEVELLTNAPPPPAPPAPPTAPLTSDIIKVPSAEEMKKGAKIETIKAEDIEKEIQKQKQAQSKPADAAK